MSLEKMKKYDHDNVIETYKVVLRLKNNKLVSFKNHVDKKLSDYVYFTGLFKAEKDTIGLHSYKTERVANEYAKITKYYLSAYYEKYTDVESVCILNSSIPADAETQIGYMWHKNFVAYCSDKLIVDATPYKEYVIDTDISDDNRKYKFKKFDNILKKNHYYD